MRRAQKPRTAYAACSGFCLFVRRYRRRIALAGLFLALAAASVLALPGVLRTLIDRGLVASDPSLRVMAVREHHRHGGGTDRG